MTEDVNPQLEALRRMKQAPAYNRWLVARALPYVRGRVLDLGAGTGTFTRLVADAADEVVAVEPDPELIPILRETVRDKPNVSVVEARAELLSELSLGPLDAVLCLNVIEHIPDDAGVLASVRDVLAPGGRLLLLAPAHPFLYGGIDRMAQHERRYRPDELRSLLGRCGLEVEVVRLVNPLGALGWLVSSRILGREHVPKGPLAAYDRLVPLLRLLDRLQLPFGLSVWAVALRPR